MDRLSDYDYILPESAIAQTPLEDRAASRLLVLHRESGVIEHRVFRDATKILGEGDLLIVNDTRVSALRLKGRKPTGGQAELLLLKQLDESRYEVLAKPGKSLIEGIRVLFECGLEGVVESDLGAGRKVVCFSSTGDLRGSIALVGAIPLPPYIHEQLKDPERYQTVYAARPGSSAAPTAGLHFTQEILKGLRERGIGLATVTLDVGLDTFRPVQSDSLKDHKMHGELCTVPPETAEAIQRSQGRIIAVGTTAVRTLESFAIGKRKVSPGTKTTSIFIRPGYQFKVIDGMFTNFHMPRTTMLIMLAALVGREPLMRAYGEALERRYRFLSFGDSMLIL